MNVFITDGDQRSALAITRSLGKRGISVFMGEEKSKCLASKSRYCKKTIVYPSPSQYPDKFIQFILNYVKENRIDVIFPVTDVTMYLIAKIKKKIAKYTKLPLPEFDVFDLVSNKYKLLKSAVEYSIPVPKTFFIEDPSGIDEIMEKLPYPVIAKPYSSRILSENKWIPTKVHYVKSKEELIHLYKTKEYFQYPSLIQERINGHGAGIFVVMNKGELISAFAHKRLREKPPSGGVSVLRESIPIDPALKKCSIKLLSALGWHGVAMIEFKVDRATGKYYLMEVNGRFWGSLQLSIDAGIDFPYILYQLATGVPVEVPSSYNIGVKSRWLLGDLDHTLIRLIKKDEDINVEEGFPSRIQTLLQFLKFYEPNMYYEVLSIKDPLPFVYEFSQYLTSFFKRSKKCNA